MSQERFAQYVSGWHRMMSKIWLDRLQLMGVYHRGMLQESVRSMTHSTLRLSEGYQMRATYSFLTYGMYVDAGVGKGYRHGNGGDLHFLDKVHRAKHNLGKARERRPWMSVSWRISRRVLVSQLSQQLGKEFVGLFSRL